MRVFSDDLVANGDIAKRLGVKPNVVSNWRKRHSSFPEPLVELSTGPVWDWVDVSEWVDKRIRDKKLFRIYQPSVGLAVLGEVKGTPRD